MPPTPQAESEPAPSDCFIIVGLFEHPDSGVWGSAQIWVVAADTEEEAVEKVSPLSACEEFVVQVAPVFPRFGPLPEPPPMEIGGL